MISVVIPIYNESGNIEKLFDSLTDVLADWDYEIIAVNDGSKDDSWMKLKELASSSNKIKIVNFVRNFGQTAALNAGIKFAKGDLIVLMDSDLENDPKDIPLLVAKLENGYDVVSGWRKERWSGQWLTRKLPSLLANRLISKISNVRLHDYGCTLKAYKREVIKEIDLYGDMHRFIPIFASWFGGKVTEVPVSYTARVYGQSNYGIGRTYKVILDLVLIKFLYKFQNKPIHFFGGAGILSFLVSFVAVCFSIYFKVTGQKDFVETPLPLFSGLFFIIGILMILLGILAEVQMRTYYESQNKSPFIIKEVINLTK